jgi:DNA-binding NarL/FixJ family response regulator
VKATIAIVGEESNHTAELHRSLDAVPDSRVNCIYRTGASALSNISDTSNSIVIINYSLSDMPSLECAQRLKIQFPSLLVVFINAAPDVSSLFKALRIGAVGYLDRSEPTNQVIAGIQYVRHGGVAISRPVAEALALAAQSIGTFTKRENSIINGLLAGQRQKEIAKDLGISVNTVQTQMQRMFRKHHVHSSRGLLRKFIQSRPIPSHE